MVAQSLMNLRVTDLTSQLENRVQVDRRRRIVDVRPQFLAALELPVEKRGEPLAYGVVNATSGLRLGDTDIVGETAQEDDLLRLCSELTAGAGDKG